MTSIYVGNGVEKTPKKRIGATAGLGLLVLMLGGVGVAYAQMGEKDLTTGAGGGFECTQVRVDYEDDPSLTPEERLERMDQAFQRSLSLFDACQLSKASANGGASGSNGATGGDGGAAGGMGANGTANGQTSVAASDMSGDQPASDNSPQAAGSQADENNMNGDGSENGAGDTVKWNPPDEKGDTATLSANEKPGDNPELATRATLPSQNLENGKVPEDIPPADNDSILEAQIRQAAINETDPETKAKLWNEYRKYKGLPVVN